MLCVVIRHTAVFGVRMLIQSCLSSYFYIKPNECFIQPTGIIYAVKTARSSVSLVYLGVIRVIDG